MKRMKSEKEQYLQKRAVRFVRRVQALVLAGAILLAGGFAVHAATVADVIDTQYYADKYPDLKAAFGYDSKALVQHYLQYGIAEGRDAGGLLDVREYREAYADLDAAFGDDWDAYVNHFLTYGAFEGRNSGTDFNALDYAARYKDLRAAFGTNVLQLYQHYMTYGKNEHREARSEAVVVEERRAAEAAAALEERRKLYPVLTDKDGNVPDLGGMEIIIRDWWSSADGSDAYNEYETYLRDYQEWAMWRYNFTIKRVGMDGWNSYPQSLVDYVDEYKEKGGDNSNYVFVLWNSGELLTIEREGNYAYDLATLDCLKFKEEKWVSGVHEYHTVGNSIYAMNFNLPEPRNVMYFNKSVLRGAGINPDDIYKWQESGEWTWAKFEEVCEKVRKTYGWALSSVPQELYVSAVYSNNGDFVGMENGKYVNGLTSSKTQKALSWALDIFDRYSAPVPAPYDVPDEIFDYYYEWVEIPACKYDETTRLWHIYDEDTEEPYTVELYTVHSSQVDGKYYNVEDEKLYESQLLWSYPIPEFRQNVGAFFVSDVGTGTTQFGLVSGATDIYGKLPQMNKADIGIVCFPKGPDASDYTNIYNDNAYVIPGCYDATKAWNIAFALNAWTMPISGYDEEEAVLNTYYQRFGDTESVDLTIKRLLSNGRVTYDNAVPELVIKDNDEDIVLRIELGNDLIWDLEEHRAENYRTTIEKWDKIIEAANSKR